MAPVQKVAVIGGGIIGITTALRALETVPNIEVTLMSDKFSPFTTGDGSAGFWKPYLIGGDVPDDKLRFWCEKTFKFLEEISKLPDAQEYGVGLLSCYTLSKTPVEKCVFSDIFTHYRSMTSKELAMFPERYKYGEFFTTFFAECSKLLPVLMKKIKNLGGIIVKRKLNSFAELCGEYDVVLNCSGLSASTLVPDASVIPIRGQVIRVQAPWIKHAVMDDDFYILLNSDEIICGGTHQEGDWNTQVDPEDRRMIWKGCTELVPSLKGAKVLREWVGLRPGRYQPRIERETLATEKGNIEVIHNYGHGGSGVTVSWGCAQDAVALLEEALTDINLKRIISSL